MSVFLFLLRHRYLLSLPGLKTDRHLGLHLLSQSPSRSCPLHPRRLVLSQGRALVTRGSHFHIFIVAYLNNCHSHSSSLHFWNNLRLTGSCKNNADHVRRSCQYAAPLASESLVTAHYNGLQIPEVQVDAWLQPNPGFPGCSSVLFVDSSSPGLHVVFSCPIYLPSLTAVCLWLLWPWHFWRLW